MAMICSAPLALPSGNLKATARAVLCVVAISLTMTSGCEVPAVVSSLFPSANFHTKLNLRAEEYFDDPQVLELCAAIEDNDINEMKRLIAAGVDINTIGNGGVTPLFWAFPDNQLERFTLLLENGADPNVHFTSDLNLPDAFRAGDTVMHMSARSHFPNQFLEVMKRGGDPTIPGSHGDSVLHEIIRAGVPNADERISAAVARGADINAIDRFDATPIETAVGRFGQYDVAIQLLRMGADPTIKGKGRLENAIHLVLAEKRSVDRGQGIKIPSEYQSLKHFIGVLRESGYNVDQAQEDIERWKRLYEQNPEHPGWYRDAEIRRLQTREAELESARQHAQDQGH